MTDKEKIELLRNTLAQMKRKHFHVEDDPWFCCPKCEACKEGREGMTLGEEHYGSPDCNCSAEEINNQIEQVLEATK